MLLIEGLKCSFGEVREKLFALDEDYFLSDTLRQLIEFQPSEEEIEFLSAFTEEEIRKFGPPEQLVFEVSIMALDKQNKTKPPKK